MKMAQQIVVKDEFWNPHKVLHENITLLLNFHSAPDELKSIIKENMFKLPNQKGFFAVTNYINSIIDKEKWNSIISWPVINKKDEMKFRRAVVKFTADLNALYDVTVVPTLNPSVLMSPGGPQVARFILKLSEYAIRKYMEKSLGLENTLQCLKNNIPNSIFLKSETLSQHKNVQCLKHLEVMKKNMNYGLKQRKHMQQQILKMRASNDDLERQIILEKPENNSNECIEQWTSELNKRIEKSQSDVDYLAGIDNSVNRYHEAANLVLEKDASNFILDGSKIMMSSTDNNKTSSADLTSFFKTSAAIARRLALKLKSSESTPEDSDLTSSILRIETEVSLEAMKLELLEKDTLSLRAESQKAINELEPKAFSCVIDEEKIPAEFKNYAASPALNFAKTDTSAKRLPIACPVKGNNILDWVQKNIFEEVEKVPSNRNTPIKRDHISLIPKKGLIVKKTIGLGVQSTQVQSPVRVQRNLGKLTETPKRNSFGPVRRLIQDVEVETPEREPLKDEDSIVLPHNLSVSTASPCNTSTYDSPDSPAAGTCWQHCLATAKSSTVGSNAASSIAWAGENDNDIFSSTPFMINHSVCSSTGEHQSQDMCLSSPSGAVHLPADMCSTSNRHRKMRPSIENIVARYQAFKRNKQEKSDE
ncbi:uncharacterized protein LOC111046813 [Nilaparvata lugens]|uniref:uncharacterized protein LOC111046813 n=1 Tax=Nilaparvata lugens TaxID=108931 RepID=UPI00193D3903|nr:uncharacterized protein LOC111046813 [Nilaparvata lugens]